MSMANKLMETRRLPFIDFSFKVSWDVWNGRKAKRWLSKKRVTISDITRPPLFFKMSASGRIARLPFPIADFFY